MTNVLDLTAAADITETTPAWVALKNAAIALQAMQIKDGSIPEASNHASARELVAVMIESISELAPSFPHDASYLDAVIADLGRWVEGGFGEPDFLASILEFAPAANRVNGVRHLVVFPMYTQIGRASCRERVSSPV